MSQHRIVPRLLFLAMLMVVHAPTVIYAQEIVHAPTGKYAQETFTKEISGFGGDETGHYYLIASPVGRIFPEDVVLLASNGFDLYYFNQDEEELQWRNFSAENFDLEPGKGYLYANTEDVTLIFSGVPYDGPGEVTLSKSGEKPFAGWNLVGNPINQTVYIYRDFYKLNEDGSEIVAAENPAIEPMEGFFVIAQEDGEVLTFHDNEDDFANGYMFALNLCSNSAVIDRAIVRFGPGRQLPKFQLNKKSTKLYIPVGDIDYAVVRSQGKGEMPIHFMAKNDGSYTISLSREKADFSYLHLIDKLTGNDIDLLANPSYTFEAKTTDDAARFRVVYSAEIPETNQSGESPYLTGVSSNRINRLSKVPQLPAHLEYGNQPAGEEITTTTYYISVEARAGGTVSGEGEYEENTECTLEATPDPDYEFLDWTEDGEEVSTDNPYTFTVEDNRTLTAHFALVLFDGIDNSVILNCANPQTENVKLEGRTIYMDGYWNTLCVPFSLESLTGTPLEGFKVKQLDTENEYGGHKTGFENGTLYLNFEEATSIDAGIPYIIQKLAEDDVNAPKHAKTYIPITTIENPTFRYVSFNNADPTAVTSSDDMVSFMGIYDPVSFDEDDKAVLFLSDENTLYYPIANTTINSFRAYFKLNGIECGEPSQGGDGINNIVLNFGDESTGISITLNTAPREDGSDLWFAVDGRKLNGKPTMKGIYINNGNKVVIK